MIPRESCFEVSRSLLRRVNATTRRVTCFHGELAVEDLASIDSSTVSVPSDLYFEFLSLEKKPTPDERVLEGEDESLWEVRWPQPD